MSKVVRRAMDPAVADDRRDELRRRNVERGIEDAGFVRRRLGAEAAPDLVRGALLDRDPSTARRRRVERAPRRGDVEWNAVIIGRDGERIRADLVGDVAVR